MHLDFKKERDEDFINAYNDVVKSHGKQAPYILKDKLIEETILHPAKRFYVSHEQASRIIMKMIAGKKTGIRNTIKAEMYQTILSKIRELQRNSRKSVSSLLSEVIDSPAPRFYISKESASILYYTLIKRK